MYMENTCKYIISERVKEDVKQDERKQKKY